MQADILLYIGAFLAVLGILVTFHEFGHYLVARWSGVQVVKFCVGFGQTMWSRTDRHGTEFALAAIPLGGFVRMFDDRDPKQKQTLNADRVAYMDLHPAWRVAIALGGPVANFILAIVVFWLLQVVGVTNITPMVSFPDSQSPIARAGWQAPAQIIAVDGAAVAGWRDVGLALTGRLGETGVVEFTIKDVKSSRQRVVSVPIDNWHAGVAEPDVLGSLGLQPTVLAMIGGVIPDTRAAQAGLQAGDWIQTVDGKPVATWKEWAAEIDAHPDQTMALGLYRQGQLRDLRATPAARTGTDGTTESWLGVHSPHIEVRHGPLQAVPLAIADTWNQTLMILGIIKKMFTGQVSVKNFSGPISIARIAGDSVKYSLRSFATILGYLSISLGVLNLLPVPILDGGQVVLNSAEWIFGKPVPERIQLLGVQLGVMLVGALLLFATYNDLLRLFN